MKDIGDNDDNRDEPSEDEYDDKNDDRRDGRNDDKDNDKNDDMVEESRNENETKKQKEINKKIITNVARNKRYRYETQMASAVMMKYLLDKKITKTEMTPQIQLPNADMFFSRISATIRIFLPVIKI